MIESFFYYLGWFLIGTGVSALVYQLIELMKIKWWGTALAAMGVVILVPLTLAILVPINT